MGTTLTPMVDRAFEVLAQRAKTGFKDTGITRAKVQSPPQSSDRRRRGSTAAAQASIMLFLLSPESFNITGATYATGGGFTTY